MSGILETLSVTPLPTILVVAGLLFLVLPFIQKAGGIVEPRQGREGTAMFIGVVLTIAGISLYLVPGPGQGSSGVPEPSVEVPSPEETSIDMASASSTPRSQAPQITCVTLGEVPVFDDHREYINWYDRFFETEVPFELQWDGVARTYATGVYLVNGTVWPVSGGSLEKVDPNSALGNPQNQITGVAKWIVTSESGVLGGSGGRAFRICE